MVASPVPSYMSSDGGQWDMKTLATASFPRSRCPRRNLQHGAHERLKVPPAPQRSSCAPSCRRLAPAIRITEVKGGRSLPTCGASWSSALPVSFEWGVARRLNEFHRDGVLTVSSSTATSTWT